MKKLSLIITAIAVSGAFEFAIAGNHHINTAKAVNVYTVANDTIPGKKNPSRDQTRPLPGQVTPNPVPNPNTTPTPNPVPNPTPTPGSPSYSNPASPSSPTTTPAPLPNPAPNPGVTPAPGTTPTTPGMSPSPTTTPNQ